MPQLKCFCMNRDMENTTITTILSHYTGSLIVLPMDANLMIISLNQVRSHSPPTHHRISCWFYGPYHATRSMDVGRGSKIAPWAPWGETLSRSLMGEMSGNTSGPHLLGISGEYLVNISDIRWFIGLDIWWISDDWSFIHHPCFSTNSFSAFPPYLHLPHLAPIWAFLKDQAKRFLWLCLNIARLSYTISTIYTHTRKYIYIYK